MNNTITNEQILAAFEAAANGRQELTRDKNGQYRSNTTQQALDAFTEGARWMQGCLSAGMQPPAAQAYGKDDPLYEVAVAMVKRNKKASISMIQRELHIAYTRAAYLIEAMEGTVVSFPTNGVRQVLDPTASPKER